MSVFTTSPTFYMCGICDHFHNALWNGDCRQDNARFTISDLHKKWPKWDEIDMKDVNDYQADLFVANDGKPVRGLDIPKKHTGKWFDDNEQPVVINKPIKR